MRGPCIEYQYDNAGGLNKITDFAGSSINVTSDAEGDPVLEALPTTTGDTIASTFDPAGNPSSINLEQGSSTLLGFSYKEAPSGDGLSVTDTGSGVTPSASCNGSTVSTCFANDPSGAVAASSPSIGSIRSYSPEPSGNIQGLPSGASALAGPPSDSYDDANELTSSALSGSTTTYAYNADGELTGSTGPNTLSATWNGAGSMLTYNNDDAASATGANMSTASYDGDGVLMSETSTPEGGSAQTENLTWDDQGDLLMDSNYAFVYDSGGTPIEQISLSTGVQSYLLADANSSVRGIIGSSGALNGENDI